MGAGLGQGMEHAAPLPRADFVSERPCDFAEALAAMHELVGRAVTLSVLGGLRDGRHTPVALQGAVRRGYELGRTDKSPVCFEVAGALVILSADSLAAGWREEYRRRSDGRSWLVVTLEYAGGARVELEELI